MHNEWLAVQLNPGDVVFVPWGFCPLVCTRQDYGHFLVIPWMPPKHEDFHDQGVSDLIYSNMASYLRQVSSKAPWNTIAPLYKTYRAAMLASMGDGDGE